MARLFEPVRHRRAIQSEGEVNYETHCDNAKRFGRKMHIDKHITDPHVIAAFNDMTLQGTAEFVRRDDGALLMVIRSKATEEVVFKVTRTGLYCLARFEV